MRGVNLPYKSEFMEGKMSTDNCIGKKIKRITALLITAAIIYSLTGCVKEPMENSNISSDIVYDSQDTTGFDIDTVRKSIIVKGVSLELPKRIGDLEDKWTYKKRETHYVDDTGLADFYYNGNEMFVAGIGNFKEGKEDDGYIYDVALETDDCSIGGITPNVSTKDDVLKKYGEPTKINVFEERGLYRYIYGIQESNQKPFVIEHSQMFTVVFYSENDIVQGVRVVYNTLNN